MNAHIRTAIIGAGPFGLSVAGELRRTNQPFLLLGRPMSFWREHVPPGTRLLSRAANCSLSRRQGLDWPAYSRAINLAQSEAISSEQFLAYGLWFQEMAGIAALENLVADLETRGGRFQITLDDGTKIVAETVIVAISLKHFAYCHPEFARLPAHLASHTSELV